jgi:hypothetical protein
MFVNVTFPDCTMGTFLTKPGKITFHESVKNNWSLLMTSNFAEFMVGSILFVYIYKVANKTNLIYMFISSEYN